MCMSKQQTNKTKGKHYRESKCHYFIVIIHNVQNSKSSHDHTYKTPRLLGLGLGLGLEAKFSILGIETFGLGLEAFGLGLVFLALASFKAKAKAKVTNILPNTVYHGIITLTVHWYTSVMNT